MIEGDRFDLLGNNKNIQTPLFMSLVGFRKTLSNHLGISELPLIMSSNTKVIMRRENEYSYPYGYFKLLSVEIQRDAQAVKTIRRTSSSITLDELTNAMISKGYLFPTKLETEVHFIHNDLRECLGFVEKLAILGAVDGFSFTVKMPGSTQWVVGVQMAEGPISFPDTSNEDPENPGAYDIQTSFTLNTKSGVIKSVPKINNEGKVTQFVGRNINDSKLEL